MASVQEKDTAGQASSGTQRGHVRPLACFFAICVLIACTADSAAGQTKQQFAQLRNKMVDEEIVAAGVTNERVIDAMRQAPRHEFVPLAERKYAYFDMGLPIGHSQTISPPFVVAYMTEQLDPQPSDRVLEIGTGSGYQAAVLSGLVEAVYSIEIVEPLARQAAQTLKKLKYDNVHVRAGDGFAGWPSAAPFDKIIVTCSPENVPAALVEELKEGGRMVVPVGERYQQTLYLLTKRNGKLEREALRPTLFVPMTGAAEQRRAVQPDPLKPTVVNGSFEEALSGDEQPSGWHYQRQLQWIEDPSEARAGKHFALFTNEDLGRGCRALQGFAVDGRKLKALDVSLWVRGEGIRPGQQRDQWPRLVITFYDERRAVVGRQSLGPWRGTFAWQREAARLRVPPTAREAILRIGLLGAVGELAVDDVRMEAVQ